MKYLDYKEHRQQGTIEFPLAFYHMEPTDLRYQMTYHWHPEYEIILIKEGSFHLTLDGEVLQAKQGDIYFIPAGVLHGGVPENCIYECIVFDLKLLIGGNQTCNKLLQRMMEEEIYSPLILSDIDTRINETIKTLFRLCRKQSRGYEFMIQGCLFQLMGILCELSSSLKKNESHRETVWYINRLKEVILYIENNYTEAITLESMAKTADLNPRYFCRFFKKLTNRTPIEYLNYYRIECACNQLKERALSITEIAHNCGFNDSSYFIKVFRASKGLTPRQYRMLEGID